MVLFLIKNTYKRKSHEKLFISHLAAQSLGAMNDRFTDPRELVTSASW